MSGAGEQMNQDASRVGRVDACETSYAAPAFAVIGMSGRFPGAQNPAALWENVRDGVESITFFGDEELLTAGESPERLSDPAYVKASGRLEGIGDFDAAFFGLSPRDAAVFDPQHRVFLECAWEAFESAGYVAERFGGPVGVFAASGGAEYLMHNLLPNRQIMETVGAWLVRHMGNDPNFLATRASYQLNLTGPSMSVQTACSSSLAAVHLACQSLMNGECDMALAGGSTIYPEQNRGYIFKDGEILSPDGHCRAFDASAAGTVMASAVGCVVIRRLEDALRDGDQVLAVIRGSAINNDGSQKVGYLAPSVTGQARVVSEALAMAGIDPGDVSYIEAHGTGTVIGDPIEITALTQAFRAQTDKKQYCAVGSIKSNIGHAGEASGVCGFIKTILAMQHRQIPPSLHFETPNPQADFENSPFFVNSRLREWTVPPGKPRIAGVTSLGAGGTNVHILLEEAPERPCGRRLRSHELLVLSAKSAAALDRATDKLATHLRAHPNLDLAQVAFTLFEGRKQFGYRRAVVARDAADALTALDGPDRERLITNSRNKDGAPAIFFTFPGGGAQYARMGADLYEREAVYRDAFEEALSYLEPVLRADVRGLALAAAHEMDAASERLEAPSRGLPALLATELAIARLLSSWGVTPTAMIGHSAGEYAAACIAGVITVREAMTLVALRGQLFETLGEGGMLSVPMSAEEASEFMGPELSIAAINAPSLCVLSGPVAAIARAEQALYDRNQDCTRVRINVAAHSALVDPILPEFERVCHTIDFRKPRQPFISNVTGTWITDAEATDPKYWVRHLRGTVRFAEGVRTLMQKAEGVFCEIGPGRTLTTLVRQQPGKVAAATPTLRHAKEQVSDVAFLLGAVGRMWTAGVQLGAGTFMSGALHQRVSLPTYPFERQRYWVNPDPVDSDRNGPTGLRKNKDIGDWFYAPSWARSAPRSSSSKDEARVWLVLSDNSTVAKRIVQHLRDGGHNVVEVLRGTRFAKLGELRYSVDPGSRSDFDSLANDLRGREALPQRIVHLWALAPRTQRTKIFGGRPWNALKSYDRALALNYFSITFLAQVFAADADTLRMFFISSHAQSVPGDAQVEPEKAVLLGPSKVIPREYPQVSTVNIDVVWPDRPRDQQQLADRLISELTNETADVEVALRGSDRWVRRFDAVRLDATTERSWLRQDGVYIITGGFGGIGLSIAEHLASSGRVKLALIGRTPLPPEDQWSSWLAARGHDHETSRRITAVRSLRALGAQVMPLAADVTDLEAMRAAIGTVHSQFGSIHGVFHTAGVLHDELIALRGPSRVSAVIDSKAKGALVLDEVLADDPLELFVLFSSVSSILGLPGQVDYTAANAFLDAFAHERSRRGKGRTLSIDWNAWKELGMLAKASQHDSHLPDHGGSEPALGHQAHPMLGGLASEDRTHTRFRATLRRSDTWLLSEHVVRGGEALIPGTGFLEIARAALERHAEPRAVELRDVYFLAPFSVPKAGQRDLHLRIQRDGDHEFACYAESENEPMVVGKANYVDDSQSRRADIDAIRSRCPTAGPVDNGHLIQHFMDFGPRWGCVKHIDLGEREALITLELPSAFVDDLNTFRLHPALMDLATGGAQAIVPGFDPRRTFYVPFSYSRVVICGALTPRVYSHVRLRESTSPDSVTFDAKLYDDQGVQLVMIEGFTMRRAAADFIATTSGPIIRAEKSPLFGRRNETATQLAIREGMLPAEGLAALDRMLAVEFSPQVVACTVPLHDWLRRLEEEARGDGRADAEADLPLFARPTLDSTFVAPRTQIERSLATLWSALLGVAQVGVHDDFFELGGTSLVAVRLFARIQKEFGVDLALESLFRAPTIASCSALVAAAIGVGEAVGVDTTTELSSATSADARFQIKGQAAQHIFSAATPQRIEWSPLVPIQVKGSKPRFFCVHGAGGNVLNLRDLSRRLGDDQPFYGLQAQGVDGILPPQRRIEDMAEQYVAAIRQVQPHGPYVLGGYSGGGAVAVEIAQRLRTEGAEVPLLVFFDTYCPVRPPRPKGDDPWLTRLRRWQPAWWPGYEFAWNRLQVRWRRLLGRQLPYELRDFALFDAFLMAQEAYRPPVYFGDAILLRAEQMDPAYAWVGEDLGWGPFINGRLDILTIPGTHHTLMLEPNVEVLASALKFALDSAAERYVEAAA